MSESIIDKISLLSDLKDKRQTYKIMPTLSVISLSDLKENIEKLSSIGIIIKHVFQIKVCALDPKELASRIDIIKKKANGERYVKDPLLLLNKNEFISSGSDEAPKEEAFEIKLPTIDDLIKEDINVNKEPVSSPVSDLIENDVSDSIPEVEVDSIPIDHDEEPIAAQPKELEQHLPLVEEETPTSLKTDDGPTIDHLDELLKQDPIINISADEEEKVEEPKEEELPKEEKTPVEDNKDSELDKIVNDTTITLGINNFEKYQYLTDVANKIINDLSINELEKTPEIYDCMAKLIAIGENDHDVIYKSLSYKKNFSADELEKISMAISHELSTNKFDGEEK